MTLAKFKLSEFTELLDSDGSSNTHKGPYRILVERLLKTKSPKDRTGPRLFTLAMAGRMIGIDQKTIRTCEKLEIIPPLPRKAPRMSHGTMVSPIEGVPLSSINILRDHYKKSKKFELNETGACVVAVSNQKGGVGKSGTSNNLSQGLALMGYRVCIIDHDSQATQTANYGMIGDDINTDGFTDAEVQQLRELYVSDDQTLTPFYDGEESTLHYALKDTAWDNVKIIPTNKSLFTAELNFYSRYQMALSQASTIEEEDVIKHEHLHKLAEGIETIKDDFDVIIIDGPPSLSMFSLNIMAAADGIIIPMPPKIQDIASTISYQETIANLLHSHKVKEPSFLGIVSTLFQPQKKRTHVLLYEIFKEAFTSKYHFKTIIKNVADIEEAYSEYLSPYEYDKTSKATRKMLMDFCVEVDELITEIKGKEQY